MNISLVIPGRNCQRTLRACLSAVAPLLHSGALREIIFVDDGSTDATASIAREFPVRVIAGTGGGAGAARNLGWRAAQGDWIWFIDSDCVAEPQSLALLAAQTEAGAPIAGIGGSYENGSPTSLIACLIHEEIAARHARMPADVNFLGTFHVLYRRGALVEVGGFDECRYNGPGIAAAEDAELAFRLRARGYGLRFEPRSRVGHFHPTRLGRYLRVQLRHGFYRVRLYADYPRRMSGDSYSGLVDHAQPPLAMLWLATLPLLGMSGGWIVPLTLAAALIALQVPMTGLLLWRCRSWKYLAFAPLGFVRAVWRGWGLTAGVADAIAARWSRAGRRRAGLAVGAAVYGRETPTA